LYSGLADVKMVVKARGRYSSKRDFGCLLIVGGSEVYSGAPALAGMSALRTGVGLAIIAAPRSVAATIRGYSPNLIVHSLNSDVVSSEQIEQLSRLLASSDALVLGPGIGRRPETIQAILLIIKEARKIRKPILIDADAIRALTEAKELLKGVLSRLTLASSKQFREWRLPNYGGIGCLFAASSPRNMLASSS